MSAASDTANAARATNWDADAPVVAYVTPDFDAAVAVATATIAVPAVVAKVPTEPAGFESTVPRMVIVLAAAADTPWNTFGVMIVVAATPGVAVDAVNVIDVTTDVAPSAALEGATESIPKPRDATATSATRLRSVFVDICFLSISQKQEFPALGLGNTCLLICHERVFMRKFHLW
jgi:hypothetical protein